MTTPADAVRRYFNLELEEGRSFNAENHILRMLSDFLISKESYTLTQNGTTFHAKNEFFDRPEHAALQDVGTAQLPGIWSDARVYLTIRAMHTAGVPNVDVKKLDGLNSTINQRFEADKISLLLKYWQLRAGDMAFSKENQDTFSNILVFSPWRTNIATGAAVVSPAFEIFHRMMMYQALGASDDDIIAVFKVLITNGPGPESEFASLREQFGDLGMRSDKTDQQNIAALKSFTGWLDARENGVEGIVPPYSPRSSMPEKMPEEYLRHHGFYFKPECFHGDTKVVMANGSTKKISAVKSGDLVMSTDFVTGARTKAVVDFVDVCPMSDMWEVDGRPGIQFTSIHPMIERPNPKGPPIITFVDQDLALSMNPAWESLPTGTLKNTRLVPEAQGSAVFNLILARKDKEAILGPTTFIVQDSLGVDMEVASEGPIVEWFPEATTFFEEMKPLILSKGVKATGMLKLFSQTASADIHAEFDDTLRRKAREMASTLKNKKSPLLPSVSLPHYSILGLMLGMHKDQLKSAAKVAQDFISTLGRPSLDKAITAWMDDGTTDEDGKPVDGKKLTQCLVMHWLQGRNCDAMLREDWLKSVTMEVSINGRTVAKEELPLQREGWLTSNVHVAMPLKVQTGVLLPIPRPNPLLPGGVTRLTLRAQSTRPDMVFDMEGSTKRRSSESDVFSVVLKGKGDLADQECVTRVELREVDPDVLAKWRGGRDWQAAERIELAKMLGRDFCARAFDRGTELKRKMDVEKEARLAAAGRATEGEL